MSTPAVNDVWHWNIEYLETSSGERGMITGHHRLSVIASSNSLGTMGQNLATYILGLAETEIAAANYMAADITVSCVTCQRIKPAGSRVFAAYGTGAVGLATAATTLPAQMAAVISKYTAEISKSGRGRVFLPFIAQAAQVSGVLTSTTIGAIADYIDTLYEETMTITGDDEFEGVIYSKKLDAIYEIDDIDVRPVLGTQRRRANHHQPAAS